MKRQLLKTVVLASTVAIAAVGLMSIELGLSQNLGTQDIAPDYYWGVDYSADKVQLSAFDGQMGPPMPPAELVEASHQADQAIAEAGNQLLAPEIALRLLGGHHLGGGSFRVDGLIDPVQTQVALQEVPEIVHTLEINASDGPLLAPEAVQPLDQASGATANTPVVQMAAIDHVNLEPEMLVAPVPASLSRRPTLQVTPVSVTNVVPARSVSVDPMVHNLAQGSWPRRLDQVNARNNVETYLTARAGRTNLFFANWVEVNGPNGSRLVPKQAIPGG